MAIFSFLVVLLSLCSFRFSMGKGSFSVKGHLDIYNINHRLCKTISLKISLQVGLDSIHIKWLCRPYSTCGPDIPYLCFRLYKAPHTHTLSCLLPACISPYSWNRNGYVHFTDETQTWNDQKITAVNTWQSSRHQNTGFTPGIWILLSWRPQLCSLLSTDDLLKCALNCISPRQIVHCAFLGVQNNQCVQVQHSPLGRVTR